MSNNTITLSSGGKRQLFGSALRTAVQKQRLDTGALVVRKDPMQISNVKTGARSRYGGRKGGGGYGPYQILGSGQRHTNSVYPVPETKFNDITAVGAGFNNTIPSTPVDDGGAVFTLNQLAQNVGASNRVGSSITVTSCSYRFELSLQAGSTTPTSGRVMLIWDHQPNAVVPSVATVSAILSVPSYLSFLNIANTQRFVVLRNTQFSLNPKSDAEIFFEGHVKINMASQYVISGTAYPNTGALMIMYISDQPTGTTTPIIKGCWRYRFKDN